MAERVNLELEERDPRVSYSVCQIDPDGKSFGYSIHIKLDALPKIEGDQYWQMSAFADVLNRAIIAYLD